jgi:hypothetical protein
MKIRRGAACCAPTYFLLYPRSGGLPKVCLGKRARPVMCSGRGGALNMSADSKGVRWYANLGWTAQRLPGMDGQLLVEWVRRADEGLFTSLGVVDRLLYANQDPMLSLVAGRGICA